jgi:hypothetical protein
MTIAGRCSARAPALSGPDRGEGEPRPDEGVVQDHATLIVAIMPSS